MIELFEEAIAWYNLPLTFLLVLVMIYWVFVGIGALDLESFSPDFDFDVEGDLDADMDADVEADGMGHGSGFLVGMLKFLNVGDVPVMIVASFLVLFTWTGSMLANYYLNTAENLLLILAFFVGCFLVSALLTKFITLPLKVLMVNMSKTYEEHEPIIGQVCKVKTGEVNAEFGQAEVPRDDANLLINVRTTEDSEPLVRGDDALIVSYDSSSGIYSIRKVSNQEI